MCKVIAPVHDLCALVPKIRLRGGIFRNSKIHFASFKISVVKRSDHSSKKNNSYIKNLRILIKYVKMSSKLEPGNTITTGDHSSVLIKVYP